MKDSEIKQGLSGGKEEYQAERTCCAYVDREHPVC